MNWLSYDAIMKYLSLELWFMVAQILVRTCTCINWMDENIHIAHLLCLISVSLRSYIFLSFWYYLYIVVYTYDFVSAICLLPIIACGVMDSAIHEHFSKRIWRDTMSNCKKGEDWTHILLITLSIFLDFVEMYFGTESMRTIWLGWMY